MQYIINQFNLSCFLTCIFVQTSIPEFDHPSRVVPVQRLFLIIRHVMHLGVRMTHLSTIHISNHSYSVQTSGRKFTPTPRALEIQARIRMDMKAKLLFPWCCNTVHNSLHPIWLFFYHVLPSSLCWVKTELWTFNTIKDHEFTTQNTEP